MTKRGNLRPASFFKMLDEFSEENESEAPKHYWVGIDGEGVTIGEPRNFNYSTVITGQKHLYISMSYRNEQGRGDQIENRAGLSTKDCLNFILSIPEDAKIAAYGFGYDLTKILEDLPPELLYLLSHPERRAYQCKNRVQYRPVIWNGFAIELFNTKFKVGVAELKQSANGKENYTFHKSQTRVIHDLSKFYQAKFVTACKNWDVGTPTERNTMRGMKADRRNLIKYTQEQILDYSNKECQWLAEAAQKLDDACETIGADLHGAYFGAGSIAKALMRTWKIKEQIPRVGEELPAQIDMLARFAFFGGRFEIALRGAIEQEVHDWDISSAYPYQIYHLPCLMCGKWDRTSDIERVKGAQAALVNYHLVPWKGALPPWGPFPFRDTDGSIPFPIESGGGWMHKWEFLAGQKLFPNVKMKGAWVYETSCNHKPFEKVKDVYLERLRIGKEGPGIVLKLGTNAIAGSIMQTIGTRPYHCSVWAGMITSGTRAQLLSMLGKHEKWSDVIMMATDGLWSLSKTTPPKPRDTGTDIDVYETKTGKKIRKPLGGWEYNLFEKGVFMARPGIYFPLDLTELSKDEENEKDDDKLKDLKARGIGIRTLYEHRQPILNHYARTNGNKPYIIGDENPMEVIRNRAAPKGVERFVGFKSGVLRHAKIDNPLPGLPSAMTGETYRKRDVYGLWTLQQRIIDFKALPKRLEGDGRVLEVRRLPMNQSSATYSKMESKMTAEDKLAGIMELGFFDSEQDDWAE